ncbi:MAG: hypothetical protein JXB08_05000 [Bacilli bacterium]|nr:hypothetical protein [Bacilli bacterium]MBN2877462.1 hypothetical protein [Bacilli bacterium]
MVNIVTGKMNSGKTTRMLELYQRQPIGNGILSKKYMIGSDVFGFNAYVLKEEIEFPFMIHERQLEGLTESMSFSERIGPYLIIEEAQREVDRYYQLWISECTTPLYFDEVGKLELENQGFDFHIRAAIKSGLDLYLSVREDLVEPILNHYQIQDYQIISG